MEKNKFVKANKPSLYLYNLDLPKIIFNKEQNKSDKSPSKISKINPNIKNKLEQYNIKSYFELPKIETKSPRYYQILKTDNIKELAKNCLQKDKNMDKILENLNKRESNNIYSKKIKQMIRLHSSKYQLEKSEKKTLNDEFDIVLKKLKYGNYYLNEDDTEIKYRQRLAFKYRFLQKEKNITPISIKKMNNKMNKLLSISKSIPNYLLQNAKSLENNNKEENNKKFDSINSINISIIDSQNNKSKKLLFDCSTKRTIKNDEKIERSKVKSITSCDKNGKKYLRRLNLLL